jgi:hypothetical protein
MAKEYLFLHFSSLTLFSITYVIYDIGSFNPYCSKLSF